MAQENCQNSPEDCARSTDSRLDEGLDWGQCTPEIGFTQPQFPQSSAGVTEIAADSAELDERHQRYQFSGNVEVVTASGRIAAEQITYDQPTDTIDAQSKVLFEQKGLRIAATQATYQIKKRQGKANRIDYRLLGRSAQGRAAEIEIESDDIAHLTNMSYSTCPPDQEDWKLSARKMRLDQAKGEGTARDVTLSFKGVPLFYSPYASFPIDDRRKSGFLTPKIGVSSSNGLDLSAPYYFNLAPNYDLTLTPRLMSKRGLMLGTELRYLTQQHTGNLQAEWLPSDNEFDTDGNNSRSAMKLIARGRPASRWRYDLNLNYLSDDLYVEDFGDSLAATSIKHVERRGDLRYLGDGWNLLGRVQKFQTIDDNITLPNRPYSRRPQLLYSFNRPKKVNGLDFDMRAEYVYFDKEDSVRGSRIDIMPSLSMPLRRSWGYLTPKLSARYTGYDLTDQLAGYDDTPDRMTTTFSLDSGLYYERDANWFGQSITQTLEPRLFYLYTPREDQTELPDFDSAELDFSFANLFRENRFSGADRVGDANQLTAALTSRNLNPQGEELFRASIGQIFYFDDREVQLDNSLPIEQSSSAIVAEAAAKLTDHWKIRGGLQWNPHNDITQREKSGIALQYRDKSKRVLNLAYRHSEGLLEQADISARWPLSSRTHGVARWNYSLLHDQTLESFAGIEYESCCWISRLIARQHRSGIDNDLVSSIYLQLELKGLTSIGDRIDRFLERGILGYDSD